MIIKTASVGGNKRNIGPETINLFRRVTYTTITAMDYASAFIASTLANLDKLAKWTTREFKWRNKQ